MVELEDEEYDANVLAGAATALGRSKRLKESGSRSSPTLGRESDPLPPTARSDLLLAQEEEEEEEMRMMMKSDQHEYDGKKKICMKLGLILTSENIECTNYTVRRCII